MADKEKPISIIKGKKGKGNKTSTIQTLNMISQKVIQVNKPSRYYGDRKKIKIFIRFDFTKWLMQ